MITDAHVAQPGAGRFAPSPSGVLHVGNLRTALLSWLFARHERRPFLLRIEDLDSERFRPKHEAAQLRDLGAIGLDWDAEPIRQSTRLDVYRAELDRLTAAGATYECFCTRKEIREAQSAPHHDGSQRYPGTCRELSEVERAARSAQRPPAIRLRGDDAVRQWDDVVRGPSSGVVDDVVLARWDGAIAYNLAVVVDDIAQGVDQVIRGDDLVDATATQLALHDLLVGPSVAFGHVPLVLNEAGQRLAKRDGAVTLEDLHALGWSDADVIESIARSLAPAVGSASRTAAELLATFEPSALPRDPWVFTPPTRPRSERSS